MNAEVVQPKTPRTFDEFTKNFATAVLQELTTSEKVPPEWQNNEKFVHAHTMYWKNRLPGSGK